MTTTQPEKTAKPVKLTPTITVKHFGERLGLPVSRIIMELLKNNIIASINEEIDFETASIIAQDLGYIPEEDLEVAENETLTLEKLLEICRKEKESGANLQFRAPIVTILGHVDHGKTTLLDAIRKTNVASGEVGGITQHISAYQVKKRSKLITFIDTPGHEAFSAMRERGVSIADIAVLVVAADDGVRPQTKEVINYLKEKEIPTVVAINKVDKPEANLQKVKKELAENEILIEEWGGKVVASEVSAKQNIGIDDLLDSILLVAEVEEFKANPKREALAVVLESHLDKNRGPVATALVKTGTLKVGQDVIAGSTFGRVRSIEDYAGRTLEAAGPSTPVIITGLNSTPGTNDVLQVVRESSSRQKSKRLLEKMPERETGGTKQKIQKAIDDEKVKKFNIILKADVRGTLEAIQQILATIKSEEVAVEYIEMGVGSITESDVKIAQSSGATIYGFGVEATSVARRIAEAGKVSIKTFRIIYELVDAVKDGMASLLPPEIVRTDLGQMNVLAIFKRGKRDMILGGRVNEGKMIRNSLLDVKRDGEIIGQGKLANLQMNKQNVNEVGKGNECGVTFEGSIKVAEGDKLLCYKEEEVRRKI